MFGLKCLILCIPPPFPPCPNLGGKRPTARGSIYPTSSVCEKRHFRRHFLSTSRSATPKNPIDLESPSHSEDNAVNRMPKFGLVQIFWDFEICRFCCRKCFSLACLLACWNSFRRFSCPDLKTKPIELAQ